MKEKLFGYYSFGKRYWQAIYVLTVVALAKINKNNFIGMGWSIIQPFVHILIIAFFLGLVLRQPGHIMVGNLVAGIPFWQFLMASITGGATSLISRELIIKKCYISRTMFPIADVMMHLHTLVLSFIAMYIVFYLFYPEQTSYTVIFVPFVALPLIIASTVVSIAAAFCAPYIRDIPHLLTVLLNALYWTIPIIYPYSIVPESKKIFFELNPLFILMRPIQLLVTEHYVDMMGVFKAFIVAILSIVISYVIYLKARRNVVYYL